MKQNCPDESVLAALMALETKDPRRAHVNDCPRCQARWLDLELFLEPPPLPAGSDVGDAQARMRHALDQEFERARPSAGQRSGGLRHTPWFGSLWHPRAAWGLAGVLVVGGLAYFALRDGPLGTGPDVLREEPSTTASGSRAPLMLEAPSLRAGELVLRWSRVHEADAYEVHLVGDDLNEVLVLGPLSDSTVVVKPGRVPGFESGHILGWRVVALRAGDEIARSGAGTLALP